MMLFSAITFCAQSAKPRAQWLRCSRPKCVRSLRKRLKTMRTQRGFDRARYFARSLGIEENRYTRYERAEVEPSLTLIHKMCETLRVSPNELLGFADLGHGAPLRAGTGSRRGARPERSAARRDRRAVTGRTPSARLPGAWPPRRWPSATSKRANRRPRATRWRRCARPARFFAACRPSRSSTVAEIVDDPALKDVDSQAQGCARRADPGLHRQRQRDAAGADSARADAWPQVRISPPVALPTAAITLAATASISSSVSVFSRRLQGDLQRQRFLARAQALGLEQVEHVDAGDQLLVGGRAQP